VNVLPWLSVMLGGEGSIDHVIDGDTANRPWPP
jgi:hypothetical protein